LGAKIK